MPYEKILVENDSGVAIITLNRPEVLNALDRQITRELGSAMKEANDDDDIGCIIISGSGTKAFSAGADIHEQRTDARDMTEEERDRWADELYVLGEPYCRECGYCLPCPGGMNIPAILRMERTCSHYGLEQWIRASEIGLIEVHPDRCENCGVCEPRCPFDLPIRDMVARAQQYGQAEAPMS